MRSRRYIRTISGDRMHLYKCIKAKTLKRNQLGNDKDANLPELFLQILLITKMWHKLQVYHNFNS